MGIIHGNKYRNSFRFGQKVRVRIILGGVLYMENYYLVLQILLIKFIGVLNLFDKMDIGVHLIKHICQNTVHEMPSRDDLHCCRATNGRSSI